jgi:hypothetical protein
MIVNALKDVEEHVGIATRAAKTCTHAVLDRGVTGYQCMLLTT